MDTGRIELPTSRKQLPKVRSVRATTVPIHERVVTGLTDDLDHVLQDHLPPPRILPIIGPRRPHGPASVCSTSTGLGVLHIATLQHRLPSVWR
ncbi:hypothetical protein PsYK624_125800 [Phanerochaete sordida]|uniref:Uncharacterized protein n=1 Tax=Phanerochaete sordida TaxID=48140 RepID=A0A9P3LJ71_9APHY|nr:hypothetical protein PsYK624_125800 [Phanerochaete sordida]